MRIIQQTVVTAKSTLEDILLDGYFAEKNLSLGLYG